MFDASQTETTSPSLRETQQAFFRLLVDADAPQPDVAATAGLDVGARISIYRNAYRVRLVSVLRSDHPTVAACLGDGFDALATKYAMTQPSRVRSLRDFGDGFPDFLADAVDPEGQALHALARFERTLLDVFDAPDAEQLRASALEAVGGSGEVLVGVDLHPSVRVEAPGWTVAEPWHACRAGEPVEALEPDSTSWLLWRSRDRRTRFRAMGVAETSLMHAALAGAELPTMCMTVLEHLPPTEVPTFVTQTLRIWIEDGLVTGLKTAATAQM